MKEENFLINKKIVRKQWKNFVKKETFADYFSFYKSIRNTAQSLMLQMVDFLFINDVYVAFLELLELTNNIDIMLSSKSYETISLCKQRVDYMMRERAENWYI